MTFSKSTIIQFALFVCFLFAISCSSDDNNNNNNTPNTTTTYIEVFVLDNTGNPLSGIPLKLDNNQTATTDAAGYHKFTGVSTSVSRHFVVASDDQYFNTSQAVTISGQNPGTIQVVLTAKVTPTTINSTTGGTVTFTNGTSVEFPADAFANADGSSFSGTAKVYLTHYAPEIEDFSKKSPGASDLAGITSTGAETFLYTYGAASVEIEDAAGKRLNLKPNRSSEIRLPISPDQLGDAATLVPSWHFDNAVGKWRQEGNVTKVGDYYVGDVSHFSSWSANIVTGRGTIKGKIVDSTGTGVGNIPVKIGQIKTTSKSDGKFEGFVSLNRSITIVAGIEGSTVEKIVLALNTPNQVVDIGNIIISTKPASVPITVTGRIIGCQNQSVAFFATLTVNPSLPTIPATLTNEVNGSFQFTAPKGASITIKVYDLNDGGVTNLTRTAPVDGSNFNMGDIQVCAPQCPSSPTVTDIDGNVYKTVSIGSQCWMKENLKTTKYRNGDTITTNLNIDAWSNTTSGAYATYSDTSGTAPSIYGKLYNGYAVVDSRNLCPTGWHVPTDGEWKTLENFLGGDTIAGGKLKKILGWRVPNGNATNESGFSGLPGGVRLNNFNAFGIDGYWWSSTEVGFGSLWVRLLYLQSDNTIRQQNDKKNGQSVRCLKD